MDDDLADSRTCPFCHGDDVSPAAVRCRHCGADLLATSDGPDLAGFWILGVILTVIGLAVASSADGDGSWFGLLVAGVGGILLQIAVISYGVSLGMRNRDHRSYVKRRENATELTPK